MKLLAYPLSLIYAFFFLLMLSIFHPIQWVTHNFFGYRAHKKTVVYLQFWLMRCLNILGTRFTFTNPHSIPTNQPLIIVANHQSMYDIPPLLYYLSKYHPKFVSKKELGKGVPSISYNLNHGGSVLIDRNDPKQAIIEIKKLSEYIEKTNRSAVIFPEGTRTRTGKPKEFAKSGLKILCKYAPSAYVVPITINNSWKFFKFGFLPFGLGIRIIFTIHEAISVKNSDSDELTNITEGLITKNIIT